MSRKANAFRHLFWCSIIVAAVLYGIACLHGCAPLTPEDKASIARDGVTIGKCQMIGRMCKGDRDAGDFFALYDDCITDAGLRQ